MLVDNPIANPPFSEPERYWEYKQGQPVLSPGRRPAKAKKSRGKKAKRTKQAVSE